MMLRKYKELEANLQAQKRKDMNLNQLIHLEKYLKPNVRMQK
jgi:hypothetical protein